jgi:inhibitor of KinA
VRIFPLGDSAITIEFGNEISLDLNAHSIALARKLVERPFAGMIEVVPAYASVTAFFDPVATNYSTVESSVRSAVEKSGAAEPGPTGSVEISIHITPETAPDLGRVAKFDNITEEEVIDIFLTRTYRVYMLGFLPGFAYLGEVNQRIAAPRLEKPRTKVPAGSIGIAGKQTGIYPLESPGGWNLIGRTDLKMFDPTAEHPCLLKPGDEVRFVQC